MRNKKGQAATEFAAILPFFFAAVLLVVKIIFLGLGILSMRFGDAESRRVESFEAGENVKAVRVAVPEKGFSNEFLQGGDTPSPYCRRGGEYWLCGYSVQK